MCTDAEIETVEEICQKFRDAGFPDLADHIAEAWKRERVKIAAETRQRPAADGDDSPNVSKNTDAIIAQPAPVGNAAAMRKALVWIKQRLVDAETDGNWSKENSHAICLTIDEALASCKTDSTAHNNAAMREALVGLSQAVQDFMANKGRNFYPDLAVALEAAAAALSAPPRNCDVGTAEEQAERMRRQFCAKQKRDGIIDCSLCPIRHAYRRDCTLAWAQMPYEAEEGGA